MTLDATKLEPKDRFSIIQMYEKRIQEMRARLIELRSTCKPHHYYLDENRLYVHCIGCGENHFYYPGNDHIEGYDVEVLPTITKAPPT